MRSLIVCMMLVHEMRVAEPSTGDRWREVSEAMFDRGGRGDRPWIEEENEPTERKSRIGEIEPRDPRMRIVSGSACRCESDFYVRDLGEGCYPRHLTVSRCKPKTCQSKLHQCRLLQYTVHVLRRREANGQDMEDRYSDDDPEPETPLPESLRRKWQLKRMLIAVACIPNADNRRN